MNIKETIHPLKNPNHINKISFIDSEIWVANLGQFFVTYLYHRLYIYIYIYICIYINVTVFNAQLPGFTGKMHFIMLM